MSKNRKQSQAQFKGAGHNIAAANMSVTVAVEEARSRGYLSFRDCERLSIAERDQYVDLARREWGITEFESTERPSKYAA